MSMDPAASLEQPLPAALTGSGHNWFTQYRRFPVFSAAWMRGRLRLCGTAIGATLLLVLATLLLEPEAPPWGGFVQLAVQLVVPTLLGPWLGWQARRRELGARREAWALAGAMAALVVLMAGFHQLGAEPMKQWVAERTGQVDASGQRKRVVMSIGINVAKEGASAPAGATSAGAAAAPPQGATARASSMATGALFTLWLGGGFALWGRRRELDGLARLQRERELEQAQSARREAELRLSVLAAQVEPHFLFNTLAGVRSAIATDPARASEMIDRLVAYLRAAIPRLRSDGSAEATVGTQFEAVRAYLALMAARMPRLRFDVQAPPDLLAARCPPLMLISLAENAVKHGVEMKVGAALIEVRAARGCDGRLLLTVADDGVGFGVAPAGSGIGLANIRERLQQLYGAQAALTLQARQAGGVVAQITLPLEFSAVAA